jgi:hypothetical protein
MPQQPVNPLVTIEKIQGNAKTIPQVADTQARGVFALANMTQSTSDSGTKDPSLVRGQGKITL